MGLFTKKRVKDPVCGVDMAPHKAARTTPFSGRTYHFCSAPCLTKFQAEPGRYAKRS